MNEKGGVRPDESWRLVRALHEMVEGDDAEGDHRRSWRRRGPQRYFLFDGRASGLQLPLLPKWPAVKGYSFTTWFRVEAGAATAGGRRYAPRILSLKCRGGHGVEVSLASVGGGAYSVALTHHSTAKGATTTTLDAPLREGEWHFLALSHTRSKFRTSSSVTVLLDERICSLDLSFPRFESAIRGFLGRSNDGDALHGQMGAAYLFDESLPDDKLRSLYALGPNYTFLFERSEVDLRRQDECVDPRRGYALDGSLTAKIMLAYNPSVHEGDAFLDATPELNAISWGSLGWGFGEARPERGQVEVFADEVPRPGPGRMHALRLPGTMACATKDLRSTLDCVGGVRVLFPLFQQCDLPSALPSAGDDSRLCEHLLSLLSTLLDRESAANQSFLQSGGFQLVGFLLERIEPRHLTLTSVAAVQRLSNCGKWSEKGSPSLRGSAVAHLLARFALWTFADDQVQVCTSSCYPVKDAK